MRSLESRSWFFCIRLPCFAEAGCRRPSTTLALVLASLVSIPFLFFLREEHRKRIRSPSCSQWRETPCFALDWRRYRELLRDEIVHTVAWPRDIDVGIGYRYSILGG